MTPSSPKSLAEAKIASVREFKRVFTDGRKLAGRNILVWYYGSASPKPARLGLSVSAKVGGAVLRNRLKRLIREAFRLNRQILKSGTDIVVYLRPGCRWKGLADAERDLMELCRKARIVES